MSNILKFGNNEAGKPFVMDQVRSRQSSVSRTEDIHAIEREAYEKGFLSGEKAGMEIGVEKANGVVKRLLSIVSELSEFNQRYYAEKDKEFVELVVLTARKIIQAELTMNRDAVVSIASAALKAAAGSEDIIIKVHPEDMAAIQQAKPAILRNAEGIKDFVLKEDAAVGKGGCVIHSSKGDVEARIEEGLKAVEKSMREALGSASDSSKEGDR